MRRDSGGASTTEGKRTTMKLHHQGRGRGVAAALALSACSTAGAGSGESESGDHRQRQRLLRAGGRQRARLRGLQRHREGEGVTFETSYGASGDQSRAVEAGADADVVHFSLEPDVTRLVDEGLVAEDWKDNETKGIATSSVVVFVVREGNPEDIETWDDLVEAGRRDHHARTPARPARRRWNILAAWAHVTGNGGTRGRGRGVPDQDPRATPSRCPAAAARPPPRSPTAAATCCSPTRTRRSWPSRAAPTSTTSCPPDTLLIENPAAVTTDAGAGGRGLPRVPDQPRGAGRLRQCRVPPGRRRRRDRRGRGRQRPGRPVPDPREAVHHRR